MPVIHVDCSEIRDRESFHDAFARLMGFPPFYGRNMDAWIDCMSTLGSTSGAMTTVKCGPDDILTIALVNAGTLPAQVYRELLECTAIVNGKMIDAGETPVLTIASDR